MIISPRMRGFSLLALARRGAAGSGSTSAGGGAAYTPMPQQQ